MKFPFWPDQKGYRDIDLGLSRVYQLLERLDNPHLKLPPTIHLAGTNGKGSTLSFLRSIFAEAGLLVHTYTSPHLVNFNERITLAGAEISDDFLNKILRDCKNAAEISPKIEVTYFEGITVAAFLAFSQVKADVLLLEVGMGGRLDATNVLPEVLCSIITPIAFDHTDFLGNTLAKIAFEKGGIIKKNCPVLVAKQKASALKTLENQACTANSKLKVFGRDWKIKKEKNGFLFAGFGKKMSLPLPSLLGEHQLENASLAIAAVLLQKQFLISENQIKSALQKTFWAARLQKIESGKFAKILPKNCELYLDGSHNLHGAATILKFLKREKSALRHCERSVAIHADCEMDCHASLAMTTDALRSSTTPSHHENDLRHTENDLRHPELVSGSLAKSKPKKILVIKPKKTFVIFSMLQDKNCDGFLRKIAPKVDHLFALSIPDEAKSRKAFDIKQIAQKNGLTATAVENFDEAFEKIRELKKSDEEVLVLVCGSLYLAGSFLEENATI